MKNTIIQYNGTKLNLKKFISEYTVDSISQLSYLFDNLKEASINKIAKNKWELTYDDGFNDDSVADLTDIFGKETKYTGINPSVDNSISIEVLGARDNVLLIQANKQDYVYIPNSDMFLDYQQVDFFAVNRATNEVIVLPNENLAYIALKNVYEQNPAENLRFNHECTYRANKINGLEDENNFEDYIEEFFEDDENIEKIQALSSEEQYYMLEDKINESFDKENMRLKKGFDENISFENYKGYDKFTKEVELKKQEFINNLDFFMETPMQILKNKQQIQLGQFKLNIEELLNSHIYSPTKLCDYESNFTDNFKLDDNYLTITDDQAVSFKDQNGENVVLNYVESSALKFDNLFENKDFVLIKSSDLRSINVNSYEENEVFTENVNYFVFDKVSEQLKPIGFYATRTLEQTPIDFEQIEAYEDLDNKQCDELYSQRQEFLKYIFLDGKDELKEMSNNLANLTFTDIKEVDEYMINNFENLKLSLDKGCSI